jgi:hypothetical protein
MSAPDDGRRPPVLLARPLRSYDRASPSYPRAAVATYRDVQHVLPLDADDINVRDDRP